ncbi:MAG: twin-arginine translocase TatA/TatE family subunit [Acidiphilium sp.]
MGFDSPVHWLIVIAVVALLFGGSRVGNLMGELGKGIKAFKQNINDEPAKAAPQARVAEAVPPPPSPAEAPRPPEPAPTGDTTRH